MNTSKIKNDGQYQVVLKTKITLGGAVLHPGVDLVLRGDVVKKHADSIASAKAVT